jgi:hypothetical protein
MKHACAAAVLLTLLAGVAPAEVCNLKVVTDASPDYTDLASMVHSITAKWPTTQEKCWAVWYWMHIARRQTIPMNLHGQDLTDPIRQANDYGYMMCSTVAGVNCGVWNAMGLKVKYWDISLHTVPECFYDGRWHMYDSSMSALYTLCDGHTIAGVEDIGKEGACTASGGQTEPGHIARYHCLTATSPNGFLTGADCARDLAQEHKCFNPAGLKFRYYYNEWDWGHRYILNLRDGEVYTRHYKSLGDGPEFYVPNGDKDPETKGKYGLRGNGVWTYKPSMKAEDWHKAVHDATNVRPVKDRGLIRDKDDQPAWVTYKIQSANVMTDLVVSPRLGGSDGAVISVSTNNGRTWKEVLTEQAGKQTPEPKIKVREVNGAYEALVRVQLLGQTMLNGIRLDATTMLNAKAQPRLALGKNTVYVGAGDQTESIVLWPEFQGGKYKETIVEEKNISCDSKHIGYQGVVWPSAAKEDAYLVYRLDAPGDITRVTFGGRFYNRAPKSRIEMLYSLDGKTWTTAWSLTSTEKPWDVIHYETLAIPNASQGALAGPLPPPLSNAADVSQYPMPANLIRQASGAKAKGVRSVWIKYLMNSPQAARDACSIYSVRMEADYLPVDATFKPVEVTFNWSERKADRTLLERSHTQLVEKIPARYTINVGGEDHPVVNSMQVNLAGAAENARYGYSDGKDAGGEKFVGKWLTVGKNLAVGKPYTLSAPSETSWGAGDPDGKKLTDGVAGPPYAGGTSYKFGAVWKGGTNPVITLDLGEVKPCAALGMNFHGYPWWDALKGEVKDAVEVLVSKDGKEYTSVGLLDTHLRWKDLPVNHMWPDHERIEGATFRVVPPRPVEARYVQYKVTSRRIFCATELEVLDSIRSEPFDLRVALPDEKPEAN